MTTPQCNSVRIMLPFSYPMSIHASCICLVGYSAMMHHSKLPWI